MHHTGDIVLEGCHSHTGSTPTVKCGVQITATHFLLTESVGIVEYITTSSNNMHQKLFQFSSLVSIRFRQFDTGWFSLILPSILPRRSSSFVWASDAKIMSVYSGCRHTCDTSDHDVPGSTSTSSKDLVAMAASL